MFKFIVVVIAAMVFIIIPLILRRQWATLTMFLFIGAAAIYFVNNLNALTEVISTWPVGLIKGE